ncbi:MULTISPECIES: hypothetical protein [Stenotrophomonas]|nr:MULTISPECIES: hypothetical protein [Stenotrophomonas]
MCASISVELDSTTVSTCYEQERPLRVIPMSSHEEQLDADFKTIFPKLNVSSWRMRIMEKLAADAHLVAWRAALWQLASDGADVTKIECFITDADGDSPRSKASATLAITAPVAPEWLALFGCFVRIARPSPSSSSSRDLLIFQGSASLERHEDDALHHRWMARASPQLTPALSAGPCNQRF